MTQSSQPGNKKGRSVSSRIEDLAQELVGEGLITADQLAVARVSQENFGQDLGRTLIKKGFVSEEKLLSFLACHLAIPYISLKNQSLDADLLRKVPVALARRHRVIPLRREKGRVIVAMADPLNVFALDEVRGALKEPIDPVLALKEDIEAAISRFYGVPQPSGTWVSLVCGEERPFQDESDAVQVSPEAADLTVQSEVVILVNQMIHEAYQQNASDIHIEPTREGVRIRYRVDGALEERKLLPLPLQQPVVSRIKLIAGIDIAERRLPQDGRIRIKRVGDNFDLRVSTIPTVHGEKVVLRLLSKKGLLTIDDLGFSEQDRRLFTELVSRPHGLILVTGPTGSGKSTTLYASLLQMNSPEHNIITIEDPVEMEIAGANQIQVNTKAGVTFPSALRSILRQDPDRIMIGEIRDGETAQIAVQAAITGHLVLSTLHTNTVADTVSRLLDLGSESFLLADALQGIVAQRLVRRVCSKCAEKRPVDLVSLGLKDLNVTDQMVGRGCPDCRMSGFLGRVGIFELASIDDGARAIIHRWTSKSELETHLRQCGVRTLFEDLLQKVAAGLTTLEEGLQSVKPVS